MMPLLFAGGLLVSGFTLWRGLGPFDEGLVLQAARRVADGQVPYRDFLWPYGPGQPYVLAGASELFGQSLVWWRLLRVAVDAAVGVLVFALVRRGAPTWLALAAWTCALTAMAQPSDPNPFAPALALGLAALAVATGGGPGTKRALAAGALAGAAAAFRLDFGVFAGAGVVAALWLRDRGTEPRAGGGAMRLAGGATAAWLAVAALVYAPFVALTGPADAWDALVGRSLGDGGAWRLPFPLAYDGGFGDGLASLKDALGFYVPLLALLGAALAAVAFARSRTPAAGGLLVLGLGCAAYLLSRTDEFHATPLVVACAALLPLVTRPRPLAVASLAVLALLLAHGAANRLSALADPPVLGELRLPEADGVRVPPAEARALEQAVRDVQRRVPPGEPIYTVTLRSDIVRINNPMLYVLTRRPNPLREDFGLHARPAEQRRIAAALERARPAVIVRWTDPESAEREPNERGRPSGSRLLDEWLARRYRAAARHGHYVILVPR